MLNHLEISSFFGRIIAELELVAHIIESCLVFGCELVFDFDEFGGEDVGVSLLGLWSSESRGFGNMKGKGLRTRLCLLTTAAHLRPSSTYALISSIAVIQCSVFAVTTMTVSHA